MVKFLDLQKQYLSIQGEIDQAMQEIIMNSQFIGGPALSRFEAAFALFQQASHCVGVANGTDALEIAIEALDLPAGSEIIVPANSFFASSEAVSRTGHKLVFCDVDSGNYTLDPAVVAAAITDRTKVIVVVHLYGHPCDMAAIGSLAQTHGLKVIEDCAQAHGAEFDGRRVGAIGDVGCFSFYPGKNLGAYGDGGAIVTNDEQLALKCRMIANHGRISKYDHEFEGRNSRLDGLQAAILDVKLKHLPDWVARRRAVADMYLEGLQASDNLILPVVSPKVAHAYHLFVVRTPKRDALMEHLAAEGIQTGIHYPIALPKLGAYRDHPQHNASMKACEMDCQLLSLPMGEHLEDQEVQRVITAVNAFFS
ncbi:MAG: DegT/DnrJ/EryC1/StrS family aminotransferase [Alphaproteobacteria bacterium]|nr:DegT/DnrJ/EryC1/StrS family aminotransferase [Alphaproteobacteria bacterium]